MTENRATPNAPRWLVLAAFAAVYIIWGSTYLGIRFAIETMPPFFMAGIRFLIAGGILIAWMSLRGAARPTWLHWRSAIIIGGLMLFGGAGGVTWAEQRISSGMTALLITSVPFWMILLDWLRPGGKRPGGRVFLGLALGLTGIVILIDPGNIAGDNQVDLIGVGAVLLAAFLWANGSLYSRRAALPESPLMAVGMEMFGGGVWLVIAALLTGEGARVDLAAVSARSLLALGYLITFGSLVAFTAYIWLLRVSTPARVSTYAFVNPAVAVFLGWAFAEEVLSFNILAAMVIIITSVMLITSWQAKKQTEDMPESLAGDRVESRAAAIRPKAAR